MADGVVDETEVSYLCLAIPRWEIHPARIRAGWKTGPPQSGRG